MALVAAGGARLLFRRQVVLDPDPLQALGQRLPAVLVAVLRPPRDERLAGLLRDRRLVQRKLLDHVPKQEQLPRIERLAPRPIVTPQQRQDHGLVLRFEALAQGFKLLLRFRPNALALRRELFCRFFLCAFDELLALGKTLLALGDDCVAGGALLKKQRLQSARVIGQSGQIVDGKKRVRAHA
ncbi:MAG TPA: hypothetical protein VHX65_20040 [Pirellulales bacterium]|nr:hypothetical protein [Pirellulales bacterium]